MRVAAARRPHLCQGVALRCRQRALCCSGSVPARIIHMQLRPWLYLSHQCQQQLQKPRVTLPEAFERRGKKLVQLKEARLHSVWRREGMGP
eukprot:80698-Chlamydomonas_euryale.AAC.3